MGSNRFTAGYENIQVRHQDTSQAILFGDVDQDLDARAPDWLPPELIPEGYCLQLKNNICGISQAIARASVNLDGKERIPSD
jgi:hypothetical protein